MLAAQLLGLDSAAEQLHAADSAAADMSQPQAADSTAAVAAAMAAADTDNIS